MSYQQLCISREMLAHLVDDTNNDLAALVMQFATEVDAALEDANRRAYEWRQLARARHNKLLDTRAEMHSRHREAVDRLNAGAIEPVRAQAYVEAMADVIAALPAVEAL